MRLDPASQLDSHYWLSKALVDRGRYTEALSPLLVAQKLYNPDGSRGRIVAALLAKVRAILTVFPTVKKVLVWPDSEWRWLHPVNGIDPAESHAAFHTSFFAPDYNDASWNTGRDSDDTMGGFGFGDDDFNGVDIGTPLTNAPGSSAYFRCHFTTDQSHANLELRCGRDDGIIIYVDGREVARDNMSDGPEGFLLPAAALVGQDEVRVWRVPLNGLSLPAGNHLLSISLHNPAKPSSDMRLGGVTLVEIEPSEGDHPP